MGETRTINMKQYLEVMALLPAVSQQDIEKTRQVFTQAFGSLPEQVTFDRDLNQGDGIIAAYATVPDGNGTTRRARVFLEEWGKVYDAGQTFQASMPRWTGHVFFGGIFGNSEFSEHGRQVNLREVAAGKIERLISMPDPFGGDGPPIYEAYDDYIVESAKALYQCSAYRGSLQACQNPQNSYPMRALNTTKKVIAEMEGNKRAAGK